MSKKPILLISKPNGHKRGQPIVGCPSRLVDADTRLPIPGIAQITLNIPVKGVLTCTAEVILGGIELVEDPASVGKTEPPEVAIAAIDVRKDGPHGEVFKHAGGERAEE